MASSSDESDVDVEVRNHSLSLSLPWIVKYCDADTLARIASAHFGLMRVPGGEMLRRVDRTPDKCSVCLGKIKKSEHGMSIIVICCGKQFHKTCYSNAIRANGKCPDCRATAMNSRWFSAWAPYLAWVAWSDKRRREEAWSPIAACTTVEEGESMLVTQDGLILFRSRDGVRVISKRRLNTIEISEPGASNSDSVRDISIRMRNVSRQQNSFVGVSVSGEVFAWGGDRILPSSFDREYISALPKQLENLRDIVSVAVGVHHCIAVSDRGLAFTWGYVCNINDSHPPRFLASLAGTRVRNVAAGAFHILVVTEDGQLYTFGSNRQGQLGHGLDAQSQYTEPKLVESLQNLRIASVAAGEYNSLALTEGGSVLTWGIFYGGDANPTPVFVNGALESVDVRYIAAGVCEWASCAVCREGKLYTWGGGYGGRLGHGDELNLDSPKRVEELHRTGVFVQRCSIGFDDALAVCRGGSVFSWGRVTDSRGLNQLPSIIANIQCSPDENGRFTPSQRVNTNEQHIHIARAERVASPLTDRKTAIRYIMEILNGNGPIRFKVDALIALGEIRYVFIMEYINASVTTRVDFITKPLVVLLINGDNEIKVLVCTVLEIITRYFQQVREMHRTITDSIMCQGAIGPFVRMIRGGRDTGKSLALTVLRNISMNVGTHDYIVQTRYGAVDHLLALVCEGGNKQVKNVASEVLTQLAKNAENHHIFVRYRGIERLSAVLLGDELFEISFLHMMISKIMDLIS